MSKNVAPKCKDSWLPTVETCGSNVGGSNVLVVTKYLHNMQPRPGWNATSSAVRASDVCRAYSPLRKITQGAFVAKTGNKWCVAPELVCRTDKGLVEAQCN